MDTVCTSAVSRVIATTRVRAVQSERQREHGPLIETPDGEYRLSRQNGNARTMY